MLNRRVFLRNSILASGAVASLPGLPKLRGVGEEPSAPVVTRTLGRTGIKLPVVSMSAERADAGVVRAGVKAGVVHFDTAHIYVGGKNEGMLGGVLKDHPRSAFVVATKVQRAASKEAFLADFTVSLKRLQMDYVDILYLHSQDTRDGVLDKTMIEALLEAKKSGRARWIGVSTHHNEPEVLRAAIEAKVYDVVMTSFNYRQEHAAEVAKAIDEAGKAGIGIVAIKTVAGGFLDQERTKPVNCKAALKWVLQHEHVTTIVSGVSTFDQLNENLSVNANITMTEEEKKALACDLREGGLYCDGCGRCVDVCPHGLPVHDYMRAYMYTYGYASPKQAKEVVHTLPAARELCKDCSACNGVCTKEFAIKDRIADVSRLLDVPEEFLA
jgi:uncharacterized protein